MIHDATRAHEALAAYALSDATTTLTPLLMGNINETYTVETHQAGSPASRYVLQRLNPIFKAEIHQDIDRVTRHLLDLGMETPLLVPTRDAALWTLDSVGGVWRLQTFVDGVVHSHAPHAGIAEEAGRLLGQFHRALADFTHPFAAPRLGVHDTAKHLQALRDALQAHREHVAYSQIEPEAQAILEEAARLPPMDNLPPRVVHGDPKLNNIIFSHSGQARALIDLDTLNRMPITLELGDALRSWCNPGGENQGETFFDMGYCGAALRGYAAGAAGLLQSDETARLPFAVQTIALELAARFARDALEESYFGWDRVAYRFAWEHNIVRARSQWNLARSYISQRSEAAAQIAALF